MFIPDSRVCHHARHLRQIHRSKFFGGMYGFSAKSSIPRLNILGFLIRYNISLAPFFLTSRCTMVNLSSTGVKQGLASYNEMCDLYMIYYVESDQESDLLQKSNFCWSPGPPEVSWYSLGLKDVPNAEASRLP